VREIDILWIILLLLFFFLRNAGKKPGQTQGRNRQPWDEAARRQAVSRSVEPEREGPKKTISFPIPDEVREFMEEIKEQRREASRPSARPIDENKNYKQPEAELPPARRDISSQSCAFREQTGDRDDFDDPKHMHKKRQKRLAEELCLNPRAIVQGIIMSEILQAPKSKRSFGRR